MRELSDPLGEPREVTDEAGRALGTAEKIFAPSYPAGESLRTEDVRIAGGILYQHLLGEILRSPGRPGSPQGSKDRSEQKEQEENPEEEGKQSHGTVTPVRADPG